jgi:hypothetical protein
MSTILACAAALLIGFVLGVAAEWRLIKPWVQTALRQSEVLHVDERTPRHAPRQRFMAGPDDLDARNQVGRRS